jgi:ubiquitin carboxyl-terminal hydrolase 5/13
MSVCPHLLPDNFVQSVQGKFVWKDECAKCFINQKSPEGVNLCVKCLTGGCDYHSQLHYKQSKHPIVLNFKTVLKEKKPEDIKPEQKEITKIAIGKPGGIDFSDEEWELWTELRCLECNKNVDGAQYKGIIDSIIKSESASMKGSLQAWELEIKPCAHVETLVPTTNEQLTPEKLQHCRDCDLSTNLWMCLFCGYLGCGRKNYDGTGGNGHAKLHHTSTGHTCVVKQGTITPDGQASVYCYGCDEDIADPKIAQHLSHFGVNIQRLEKTEKSIAEMTLTLNMNLVLSSVIEEGRQLIPLFGAGFTGMQNLGNSCYMNSIVQILFSLPEFRERYYEQGLKHLEECTKFSPECFICQFSKVGSGVWSGKYSKPIDPKKPTEIIENQPAPSPYQDGVRPFMFKLLVGKGHLEFSSERQQDAVEYLKHLFTYIQKIEKPLGWTDITKIFNFKQVNKLSCQICGGYKLREQDSSDLRIPIVNSAKSRVVINPSTMKEESVAIADFTDCLHAMQNDEVTAFCPKCQTNTLFTKKAYIKNWPKYLTVVAQRIKYENWVIKKDITEINVDPVVDFSFFKQPPKTELEFELQEDGGQASEPQVNQEAFNNLKTMMGYSDNRITRALLANGNDAEGALAWLLDRMDDASLDDPLPKVSAPKAGGGIHVSEEHIQTLEMMGFSAAKARMALSKCDNNPDRAIEYLFSHEEMEEEVAAPQEQIMEVEDPVSAKYDLHACVVHLGSSYQAGHYVCYIRKDNEWVLFNDCKVAKSTEPALGKGTLYLFKKSA